MKIGEVAARTGLADSSIRYYEKMGLLCPVRNEESSYREFTEEDVTRLMQIIVLRRAGIQVSQIDKILKGKMRLSEVAAEQKGELEGTVKKIKASIDLCDKLTEEQELNEINTKEYFEYTEEEEIKGNRYTHVEEWIDKFSVIAQIAWSENPLIMSFLMHPNYKRIFMVFYIVVIPVALLIIGIIEKSWSVLIPGLLIYVPVIIAYVIRKKGL